MKSKLTLIKGKTRGIVFVFTLILAGFALLLPTPEGLSIEGYRALIIFLVCAIFWITQVLPLAITSLLVLALLPLFGVLDVTETYSLFGNKAVFFIIAALILSAGIVKSGLSDRLALWVLHKTGVEPKRLLAGVYFLSAFSSFVMPEHAVAAMMLPIVLQLARALNLKPGESLFAKSLFIALVWGSLAGGVATFLGGGRNILAVAILEEGHNLTISFTDWIIAILPISLVIIAIGYLLLVKLYPFNIKEVSSAQKHIVVKTKKLGKLSIDEKKMIIILIATIGSWMLFSEVVGLATIAILAVIILFISRVVDWKRAEDHVNWGVILMYGGAIALGAALDRSGAALYITNVILDWLPFHPWILIIGMLLVTLILTEIISNAAVVAMFLPVALSVGLAYNINPIAITYIVAVSAGFAFMLPMGSPPNALGYSTGYYELRDAIKGGLIMNIVARAIFIILAMLWWPLIGINIV